MSTTERRPSRRATVEPAEPRLTMPGDPMPPRGLHAKIAEVMALVETVDKRGHNSEQHYDYATAEDISHMVRRKLGERGVTIFPDIDVTRIEKIPTGTITAKGRAWLTWQVPITYTFTDGETHETMEVRWLGVADDYSDKGFAKALTAAEKFMLRQVFLISTGDDPEESTPGATEQSPAAEAVQSARDHRTDPRPAARRGSDPSELLTQANRQSIIGKALAAGIRDETLGGKLDDALLRQIISAASGGEIRRIRDLNVGVASKVVTILGRFKDDPEKQRAALDAYFSEHPEHMPEAHTNEPEPEPERQAESQDDDDIPF